ncbi:hypothetical protein CHU92_11955 [Flavobacterium cyanobacteriorum]|uniref:Competence protein ComEC n=1 Tax=Flavobacterium cyanobacteriorum TaxID=2022802 RepID=A0A255YYV5_9FLAO|nr:ComEC/Rec2 family competence protein [Flavobacterium cyanobacteriorum]OYQ34378.1 hypothetical protein CHU92_11955 [Flavobacterium cyanobacteriorum]
MEVLRYPVIGITVFFISGIAFAHYMHPGFLPVLSMALLSVISLTIAYFIQSRSITQKPFFGLAAWLFTACAGMVAYTLHYAPNHSSHYSHVLRPGSNTVIRGVVTARLKPNARAEKYYLNIVAVENTTASGKVLITVPTNAAKTMPQVGDKLVILGELKPISQSLNPYQFNYAQYMACQNVFHQVNLKRNYYIAGRENNFNFYINKFRDKLISSFDRHQYDATTINIIKALLLGQRQDMDSETTSNYTNAGVVHILAISGLHITVLFYILNILLKPLNRFHKKGKLVQLMAILSFLWLFAFLSGLSASVLRSVVMFSFVSIGMYINRSSGINNSIAVSMLFLLLINPMLLFDVGFQLSYAAVFGIVWLQPLCRKIITIRFRMVNYLSDTVLVSLAAQIGVLPLSLYYFNQFPMLFLVANAVVVPVSTIVLVTGVIVLILNFVWADAALAAGKLLGLFIELMNRFIAWIASFEGLVLKDIPFTLLLAILLYAIIVMGVLSLYRPTFKNTITLVGAFLLFQLTYIFTAVKAGRHQEMVIFHNRGSSLLATKDPEKITVYSNDSLIAENRNILAYNKGYFNQALEIRPLENLLWFRHKKIFIIDSVAVYDPNIAPDILLLTQSPKINLERVLLQLRPKQVVADATNYRSQIARWASTCRKQKIPFHATAEKGSFIE